MPNQTLLKTQKILAGSTTFLKVGIHKISECTSNVKRCRTTLRFSFWGKIQRFIFDILTIWEKRAACMANLGRYMFYSLPNEFDPRSIWEITALRISYASVNWQFFSGLDLKSIDRLNIFRIIVPPRTLSCSLIEYMMTQGACELVFTMLALTMLPRLRVIC